MNNLKLNELIWQVVAAIPQGNVLAYGQVAKLAGYPNHARYVGSTLKKLPVNSKLPWHRVVNAKGELSFPFGSQAYETQRQRLIKEGVLFKSNKISLPLYGWNNAHAM